MYMHRDVLLPDAIVTEDIWLDHIPPTTENLAESNDLVLFPVLNIVSIVVSYSFARGARMHST